MVQSTFDVVVGGKRRPLSMPVMMSLILQSLAGNLPTCRDMSPTTHRVAPILARWVRVAGPRLSSVATAVILLPLSLAFTL